MLAYRDGRLELTVTRLPAVASGHDGRPGALELTGRLHGGARPTALVLTREEAAAHTCPVRCGDGDAFSARIPLAALAAEPAPVSGAAGGPGPDDGGRWRAFLLTDGVRVPLAAAPGLAPPAFADASGNLVVEVSREPFVDHAGPAPDGGLCIEGTGAGALVLRHGALGGTVSVPVERREGRFSAVLAAPPGEGDWEVLLDGRPVRVGAALAAVLPMGAAGARFRLDRRHGDRLTVHGAPPLGEAERSAYRQGRLRSAHYPAQRTLPLRDAVLYVGEGSPRAVHAELVRRGTDAEHLWVTDGSAGDAARVPATAVPVVAHSTAWYEALARARRIVAAGQLPAWFERRPDQTVVQTWHGPPLGRFGLDLTDSLYADHQDLATLAHRSAQWSVLVSPAPTPPRTSAVPWPSAGRCWRRGPRPTTFSAHRAGTRRPSGCAARWASRPATGWCCTRRRTATISRTRRPAGAPRSTAGTRRSTCPRWHGRWTAAPPCWSAGIRG